VNELEQQFKHALDGLNAILERTRSIPWWEHLNPVLWAAERAGREEQAAPFESSARQLLRRWGASRTDVERQALVKEARQLVASANEILHGGAAATTYADEIKTQTVDSWNAVKKGAGDTLTTIASGAEKLDTTVKTVAIAGGVVALFMLLRK